MAPRLALRFLSGPHAGAVVPIAPGAPLVVGREGADLVLQDDAVSRRHARLAFEGDELLVEDLGSTNGLYLNGERVRRARVAPEDRVLLGGCLIKVVALDAAPVPVAPDPVQAAPPAVPSPRDRLGPGSASAQGRLEDVPVAKLLQALAAARRTGVLTVFHEGHAAELKLDGGRLAGCVVDGRDDISTVKSLHRLLAWTAGTFELQPTQAALGSGPGDALEPMLADGLQQLADLRRFLPRLPARVTVTSAAHDLDQLDAEDRDLLVLAAQNGHVQDILDSTVLSDVQAAQRIAALITRGLLAADEPAA